LTRKVWERFIHNFEESGMEIYEDRSRRERGQRQLEVETSSDDHRRIDSLLQMREVSEHNWSTFYMLEDMSTDSSNSFLN